MMFQASTRGLPEGHKGSVRVIQIGEIDNNMCCGTHVTNLAQLQVSNPHLIYIQYMNSNIISLDKYQIYTGYFGRLGESGESITIQ